MNVLEMNADDKERIRKTLKSDSNFLMKHRLMDYSLFLCVEKHGNCRRHSDVNTINNQDHMYEAI